MIKMEILSEEEARKQGFVPITHSYKDDELEMLEDAILQLKNREYRVVKAKRGLVLYRLGSEVVV